MTSKTKFLSGLILLALVTGCSVSRTTNSDKILITQDSPIFDKRFESVALQDINLNKFWDYSLGYFAEKAIGSNTRA